MQTLFSIVIASGFEYIELCMFCCGLELSMAFLTVCGRIGVRMRIKGEDGVLNVVLLAIMLTNACGVLMIPVLFGCGWDLWVSL